MQPTYSLEQRSERRGALALTARTRTRTAAQWFCAVVGVLLALRGAQQFVSGASFNAPGDGWRASQQVLTALLLLVGQRTSRGALLAMIPFALYYTVLSVVGDINGHEAFGLFPIDTRDEFVHPFYAVSALLLLARAWRRRGEVDAERSAA